MYKFSKQLNGCKMMTPQCHVTIPIKINLLHVFSDLPCLNGVKLVIENITKTAFLRLCNLSGHISMSHI